MVPGPDDIVQSIEEEGYDNNVPATGYSGYFERSSSPSQRSRSFRPPTPSSDHEDDGSGSEFLPSDEDKEEAAPDEDVPEEDVAGREE